MRIRLRLAELGQDQVRVGYSPAGEALASLHVLSSVESHPLHISWSLRARSRMSAGLRDEVAAYAFWLADGPLEVPVLGRPTGARSWAEDLALLRDAPADGILGALVDRCLAIDGRGRRVPLADLRASEDLQQRALKRVQAGHPASVPVLRELIAGPEQARNRLVAFISTYWQDCLAPEWPDLEPSLRAELTRRHQAVARLGAAAALAELSPRVRHDPDGTVAIRPPGKRSKGEDLDIRLGDADQLILVPSHFTWPKMTVAVYADPPTRRPQRTVLVRYTLAEMRRETETPEPPEGLLDLLRAAGDPTRLRILQLLAHRPRSTREIAKLVGLTEAAISKHVKPLRDAGWVWTEPNGYYRYHHLDREAAGRLTAAFDQLWRDTPAPTEHGPSHARRPN